ncbi:TetR/AcrR family transcriptional regulator [Ancylobacter sp. 6x-1]|uniref:TetR/AcrR family transcriptional regulator n=1 Tax=Ancylobacter crimeensis TaxID=2579147 RepID=A0ABT0D7F7_9HYPH|nr:TetR/AcrR family transcriptional regulator [Ancylobacter crimeensis]MCK0195885.1 TetR/AcrR family transcriptional regulator [Ancylobacter crimeensis]
MPLIEKAPRRRLQPAERRTLILEEALRLFAERHYSGVSVRDIALACGINVGLLYHYFDSKDALVRSALEYAIANLMTGYAERRQALDDARAEIEAWLDTHVVMAPMLVRMVQLMGDYASSGVRAPEIDALIAGFYQSERDLLESALAKGVARGDFPLIDVATTARRIGLMLDGIFFASRSRGDDRVVQDIRDLAGFLDDILRISQRSRS